jgi:acetyl-CoA/propionyl-CoA carboxylase, biotin carboxylase, biotin carboxyl carrier protein
VEHTVTEMVTGLDLVALQIRVALGEKLTLEHSPRGASIQCRINAEDPGRNFLPGPGRVTRYREPAGPFVRVDSGIEQGREITGDYDSMFAKLIVFGSDREEARKRMLRGLDEFVVEGVPTTIPVHRWILESKEFRAGTHTTTWLERALAEADLPAHPDFVSSGPTPNRPADILVEVDGRRIPVRIFDERRDPAPRPPMAPDAHHGEHVHGEILAPMQGTIVKVLVDVGAEVAIGEALVVLEAMKMEHTVRASAAGTVRAIHVAVGDQVDTDRVLAVVTA